jgi:putative ABC transport system ATP-binding protein
MTLISESSLRPWIRKSEAMPVNLPENQKQDVIRAEHLSKFFVQEGVKIQAVNDITLQIPRGQMLAIMGPSGSGKSTLLHVLGGIELPSSGQIWINGQNLADLNDRELTLLRRRRIGFVFQSFNLVPTLNVVENVTLPLVLDGVSAKDAKPRAIACLQRVDMLHRTGHLPSQLSGGEQQRVAIARALVINPSVVLADEPTGNLDSVRGRDITRLLKELAHESQQTVIVVTHDIRVASHADRLIVLLDGCVSFDGRPDADQDWLSALKQEIDK